MTVVFPVKHARTAAQPKQRRLALRFFANLGPGLITGAADDDPSGISTYSVAGTVFGYSFLWTALVSFPLMAAVQLMCARLGMVTGIPSYYWTPFFALLITGLLIRTSYNLIRRSLDN